MKRCLILQVRFRVLLGGSAPPISDYHESWFYHKNFMNRGCALARATVQQTVIECTRIENAGKSGMNGENSCTMKNIPVKNGGKKWHEHPRLQAPERRRCRAGNTLPSWKWKTMMKLIWLGMYHQANWSSKYSIKMERLVADGPMHAKKAGGMPGGGRIIIRHEVAMGQLIELEIGWPKAGCESRSAGGDDEASGRRRRGAGEQRLWRSNHNQGRLSEK
jgi:hypothetical protein